MMYTNFYACHPKACKTETKAQSTDTVRKDVIHVPLMNHKEVDDTVVLEFSLPGVAKEQIRLEWNENVLTLTGERILNREGMKSHHREFANRKFKSVLRIGETLDVSTAQAKFEHGVLTLRISKKPVNKISVDVK